MTRYQFLAALHELLRPATYLEIGVQNGLSLSYAHSGVKAIGVDPAPAICVPIGADVELHAKTSDEFFAGQDPLAHLGNRVDLAFIDGMHLSEFALRDFTNTTYFAHERTVVAFDDVLPRNQGEASRTPVNGDWTGDVWRVTDAIREWWPGLKLALVDTEPTGILLVTGFGTVPRSPVAWGEQVETPVPAHVLTRAGAYEPHAALQWLAATLRLERAS